jgi:hypothetical protein
MNMTAKIFLTSLVILVLTACSVDAGKPELSPHNSTPATLISTPTTIPIPTPTITQLATPTAPITLPTTIPITIPAACLQYADAGEWSAKVKRTCITGQSREAIIQILFTVWLTHFISPTVPEEYRLEKFEIDSIDPIEDPPNLPDPLKADFAAVVTYSVEPSIPLSSNPASWWVAGDGFPGEDGWVRFKKDDVWIIKTSDFYEIRMAPYDRT